MKKGIIISSISIGVVIFVDLIIAFLFKSYVTQSINTISVVDLNNVFIYKYLTISVANLFCSLLLFFLLKRMTTDNKKHRLLQCLTVFVLSLIMVQLFI